MAFTPDGIAPPGIPLLGCSPPHHYEVQNGLWGGACVCIHKPAKQHADASFTQVNDPLTGQLYFPPQSIWSAQPRCWPRPIDKSAPYSPEPGTSIDPGQLKPNNG